MASKPSRSTRPTRSKADLENDFSEVASSARSREVLDPKSAEAKKSKDAAVNAAVSGLTVEKVVQKLSGVGLEVSRAIASVSEELVQNLNDLENVTEAVKLRREEMEELHGKDVIASTIGQLLVERDETVKKIDEEITEKRTTWAKEQQQHDLAVKERNDLAAKTRAREDEQYRYDLEQRKKRDTDELTEAKAAEKKRLMELTETTEKALKAREDKIAEAETELGTLRDFKANAVLKSEAEKEKAIVLNSMKRDHAHEIEILKKDAETTVKIVQNENATLKQQIASQDKVIADLQAKLAEANTKVSEIAGRALDSASSTRTLAEMSTLMPRGDGASSGRGAKS